MKTVKVTRYDHDHYELTGNFDKFVVIKVPVLSTMKEVLLYLTGKTPQFIKETYNDDYRKGWIDLIKEDEIYVWGIDDDNVSYPITENEDFDMNITVQELISEYND